MDLAEHFKQDRFAALAGVEILKVGVGTARASMVIGPQHLNAIGTVQGGAIFTLADLAFAVACNSHGTVAVAINVSISYVRAATSGTLYATARETSLSPRLGTYSVDVTDDQGNLVATFQGMAYRKREPLGAPSTAPIDTPP